MWQLVKKECTRGSSPWSEGSEHSTHNNAHFSSLKNLPHQLRVSSSSPSSSSTNLCFFEILQRSSLVGTCPLTAAVLAFTYFGNIITRLKVSVLVGYVKWYAKLTSGFPCLAGITKEEDSHKKQAGREAGGL